MKNRVRYVASRVKQVGFSIVELMVAILIGLIILAGVVQVVLTSKTSFLSQEEMSFIQENARYAMDVLGKDLQSAGYRGCAGTESTVALVAKVSPDAGPLLGVEAVRGFEAESVVAPYPASFPNNIWTIKTPGTNTVVDRPDAFVVRGAVGSALAIQQTNNPLSGDIVLNTKGNHSYAAGDYAMLIAEDCRRVGIVQVASVNATAFSLGASTVCPGPIKPDLEKSLICNSACSCQGAGLTQMYMPGSVTMPFVAHAYYVAESSVLPGMPALKRQVLKNGTTIEEEIALGVEDMDILYGVIQGNDMRYLKASDLITAGFSWNAVSSVRVSLLMRAAAPSAVNPQQIVRLGNTYNDRFMRQVVTSTFRLRNRI